MSKSSNQPPVASALSEHLLSESLGDPLEVPLNYEIITLFSEGLYRSPHKAVEELVSNSYDAGAKNVYIILPRDEEDQGEQEDSLFVVDDGVGMNSSGFKTLWKIAESTKTNVTSRVNGRLPIGQFGIGKLAAYVLSWRLTHISKTGSSIYYTTMDFHIVQSHHLNNSEGPLTLRLHKITVAEAKALLSEIEGRDTKAWSSLFGSSASKTWTVAALSDFKGLYEKLTPGTLKWVLRTGLPITSNFKVYLDGEILQPTAKQKNPIYETKIGGTKDSKGADLAKLYPEDFVVEPSGVKIAGIPGLISGYAALYDQPLDRTKSGTLYHRSNGFFIKVRGRIINLEDELFGLEPQNHSSWSRFALVVNSDGLRTHLLSSREGVKASNAINILREYLHSKFNECRSVFEFESRKKLQGLDIEHLLQQAPSTLVVEPFIDAVTDEIRNSSNGSYYIDVPSVEDVDREDWIKEFSARAAIKPIDSVRLDNMGAYDRLARLDAASLELVINREHPYLAKLDTYSKNDIPLTMVSTVEIVTDALLAEMGIDGPRLFDFFERRDRVLRVIAGDMGTNAADVVRELRVANENDVALERAVGRAFELLGMEYEPGGTNKPGHDGFLTAKLGVIVGSNADFSVVYDAKSTDSASIAADKCDFNSLETFRLAKSADFAFFVGKMFAGQSTSNSKINQKLKVHRRIPATLVTLDSLETLVLIHLRYGVPLSELRSLFEQRTTGQVKKWLARLELKLSGDMVPLRLLLDQLQEQKKDVHDTPSIKSVRATNSVLHEFDPDRLRSALSAMQSLIGPMWIEVVGEGNVVLHNNPEEILAQFDRQLQAEERRISAQ